MGKRSPPHSACTKAHAKATPSTPHRKMEPCAQHTHGGNERNGTDTTPQRCHLLLSSPTDWHPHSQMEHGAHHPLSSKCTQQAGAQSPSCHRNGDHKQSASRAIGASSRKESRRNGSASTAQPAEGHSTGQ
ncbi:hypothetical protein TcCL_ESM02107 [Trypanosoma cruzi]|nr:hypothetical protein TcCL_ESM02107 [Trypanosoma cruzi]